MGTSGSIEKEEIWDRLLCRVRYFHRWNGKDTRSVRFPVSLCSVNGRCISRRPSNYSLIVSPLPASRNLDLCQRFQTKRSKSLFGRRARNSLSNVNFAFLCGQEKKGEAGGNPSIFCSFPQQNSPSQVRATEKSIWNESRRRVYCPHRMSWNLPVARNLTGSLNR